MYCVFKRCFDVVSCFVGLVILSPVLLVTALIIKLTSAGPVFYRGVRSGLGGSTFRIFKFRSMVVDAEKLGGMSTAKSDPRITGIGGFIRRCKLDELPQLINVLIGDMSVVGPRPEMPEYTKQYVGDEELILTVRPGITDLASLEFIQLGDVLGSSDADREYEEKVKPIKNALRVRYVKERCFSLDMKILFRTLRRLMGGK
ncbi:MAG: sugar transferase [Armatimonadota bacterium]